MRSWLQKNEGLYKTKLRIVKSWVYDLWAYGLLGPMAYLGLWPSWAYGLSDLESLGSMTFLLLSPLQPVIICCQCPYAHRLCFYPRSIIHPCLSIIYPLPLISSLLSWQEEKRRDEARREQKSVACDNGLMTFLLLSLLQSGPPDNVFVWPCAPIFCLHTRRWEEPCDLWSRWC